MEKFTDIEFYDKCRETVNKYISVGTAKCTYEDDNRRDFLGEGLSPAYLKDKFDVTSLRYKSY